MKRLAWAALLAACPVFAQTPAAVEFHGVPLGARERQWQEAFPLARCAPSVDPVFADRVCVVDRQRDGAPIGVGGVTLHDVSAAFVGDRLVQITVTYDPADFTRIDDVLSSRYGPPAVKEVPVINRRGAKIPNPVARWSFTVGDIENRQIGTTLDKAVLTMSGPNFVSDLQKRQLDAVRAGAPR